MRDSYSLIAELEAAVTGSSPERRVEVLRRITTLFLDDADRFNEQQIGLFDDVLVHLADRIQSQALVQLSSSLAPVRTAPVETVRMLAFDDRIAVAGPVIEQSPRLTDSDLIKIAISKSDDHLLAMSGRSTLSEAVTDVLVDYGSARVANRLAENAGARFSASGFESLVRRAERDGGLAEKLGIRLDLPLQLLRQLLQRATELVRTRLLAGAPPERRMHIEDALVGIATQISREITKPYDFTSADDLVRRLNRDGKLTEPLLVGFVCERRYEEAVSTLALFCGAPAKTINTLMKSQSFDGLLVACKAAKLSWPTVHTILRFRFSPNGISENELAEAKRSYLALSQAAAQRTMRFMLIQEHGRAAG